MHSVIAATPCNCVEAVPKKAPECYYCRKLEFRSDFISPGEYPYYPRNMRLHYIVEYGRHKCRLKSDIYRPANITTLKQWLDTAQQIISGTVCYIFQFIHFFSYLILTI